MSTTENTTETPVYSTKGKHLCLDLWFTHDSVLFHSRDGKEIRPAIDLAETVVKVLGLHVEDSIYKEFEGGGETLLYILSESHLSVHTYPEHHYISLDVYTCGDAFNPFLLNEWMQANGHRLWVLDVRGYTLPRGETPESVGAYIAEEESKEKEVAAREAIE